MGHGFGNLYKMRNIIMYRLSPFEQKAFAGVISRGVPNVFRRFASEVLYVAPPLAIGYIIYTEIEKAHAATMRKNPADFADDK